MLEHGTGKFLSPSMREAKMTFSGRFNIATTDVLVRALNRIAD